MPKDLTKDSSNLEHHYEQPKLLIICSTLNLDYPYGATPAVWQLLKGFFEVGCDTIVIPYRGKSIRTPWWRCYPNPTELEGELYAHSGVHTKNPNGLKKGINDKIVPRVADIIVASKWKKLFAEILKKERHIDAVLLIGVPLNQFNTLANFIKTKFSCPLIYYDLDVPTSLPKHGGFSFNYYLNADVAKYDAIIVPSDGVFEDLKALNVNKVFSVHFGVDPDLYLPLKLKTQDVDVFFLATSDSDREAEVNMMVSEPSMQMDARFLVSGLSYRTDLKRAAKIPMLPFSLWRYYAGRTKINLNITRNRHASSCTSTSRPFELAAMECCIVSHPYAGLDKWFSKNDEIIIVETSKDAVDAYKWLLSDDEARKRLGFNARQRVLKYHTFKQRATDILNIIKQL